MIQKTKIAILISGRGSNMRALIEACEDPDFPAEVVLVLSNKIDAAGLEFAKLKKIPAVFINYKRFSCREDFDKKMAEEIEKSGAEIICLAGFMRLLSPWFVNYFFNRLINIHPSLLPKFKGIDAVGDAIKAGVSKSGCTVHFVREEMDSGPIIKQAEVDVLINDTKETLAARILNAEHRIYPLALKEILKTLNPKLPMSTSLSHLPELKQNELASIASIIRQNCDDVEKIILFGSYARGNYKEEKDLKPDNKSGHVSDYDILVVTEKQETALNSGLWRRISDEFKKLNLSASPRILTHDIEVLNVKLADAQYFYSEIKRQGVVLYDTNRFELAQPRELTAKEQQRRAQEYFDEWFKGAKTFFKIYKFCLKEEDLKRAAFSLHQSAEHAYKCVLLVFSNYTPKEHFLAFLGAKANRYCALLQKIFAKIREEDEYRFRLLEYAYIGGRYDPNYRPTREDLEVLAVEVNKLLKLTKEVCEERIERFCPKPD